MAVNNCIYFDHLILLPLRNLSNQYLQYPVRNLMNLRTTKHVVRLILTKFFESFGCHCSIKLELLGGIIFLKLNPQSAIEKAESLIVMKDQLKNCVLVFKGKGHQPSRWQQTGFPKAPVPRKLWLSIPLSRSLKTSAVTLHIWSPRELTEQAWPR